MQIEKRAHRYSFDCSVCVYVNYYHHSLQISKQLKARTKEDSFTSCVKELGGSQRKHIRFYLLILFGVRVCLNSIILLRTHLVNITISVVRSVNAFLFLNIYLIKITTFFCKEKLQHITHRTK